MKYTFDCDRWGSSFSVPSKVVDKYIKLSDGDFVKVLLCILCSTERECDSAKLAEKSGLSENTVIPRYWKNSRKTLTLHIFLTRYKPFYNALSMELSKGNFLLFMNITDLMLHLFS